MTVYYNCRDIIDKQCADGCVDLEHIAKLFNCIAESSFDFKGTNNEKIHVSFFAYFSLTYWV